MSLSRSQSHIMQDALKMILRLPRKSTIRPAHEPVGASCEQTFHSKSNATCATGGSVVFRCINASMKYSRLPYRRQRKRKKEKGLMWRIPNRIQRPVGPQAPWAHLFRALGLSPSPFRPFGTRGLGLGAGTFRPLLGPATGSWAQDTGS